MLLITGLGKSLRNLLLPKTVLREGDEINLEDDAGCLQNCPEKEKKKLNSGGRELDPVCPITSWRGNEKSRVLLQKALGKTAEMESPHYCLCSSGWGAGGDRGNLGTGAGASTLIPPPAATPHRQVHFQPRWPVIQRLNITNEALNGTRGLS